MADAARRKALQVAQRAQAQYEAKRSELEGAQETRRRGFAEAQAAGLSLREIGAATGLHWTSVRHIIRSG
jgi:flagellar biosynthesis/type III secretory pathway protein FliH